MLKRAFDFSVALLSLLAALPVFAVVTLAVATALGRPVLFKQLRPGKGGQCFVFLKFRTMTDERDNAGVLLSDERRLTPFGRWLRRTSLDELPQLVNVLRGDMSLVGPRPLLPEYLPLYTPEQARRHDVRPGITGWAQVNGRNSLSWEDRLALDVWYVDHRSFLLDIKVLALTVVRVCQARGIAQQGHATMRKFSGTGDVSSDHD